MPVQKKRQAFPDSNASCACGTPIAKLSRLPATRAIPRRLPELTRLRRPAELPLFENPATDRIALP